MENHFQISPPKKVSDAPKVNVVRPTVVHLIPLVSVKHQIHFETVFAGKTAVRQLLIKNPNSEAVQIEFQKIPTKGGFVVSADTTLQHILAPKSDFCVDVTWSPKEVGVVFQVFQIASSITRPFSVQLLGKCEMPPNFRQGRNRIRPNPKGNMLPPPVFNRSAPQQQKVHQQAPVLNAQAQHNKLTLPSSPVFTAGKSSKDAAPANAPVNVTMIKSRELDASSKPTLELETTSTEGVAEDVTIPPTSKACMTPSTPCKSAWATLHAFNFMTPDKPRSSTSAAVIDSRRETFSLENDTKPIPNPNESAPTSSAAAALLRRDTFCVKNASPVVIRKRRSRSSSCKRSNNSRSDSEDKENSSPVNNRERYSSSDDDIHNRDSPASFFENGNDVTIVAMAENRDQTFTDLSPEPELESSAETESDMSASSCNVYINNFVVSAEGTEIATQGSETSTVDTETQQLENLFENDAQCLQSIDSLFAAHLMMTSEM